MASLEQINAGIVKLNTEKPEGWEDQIRVLAEERARMMETPSRWQPVKDVVFGMGESAVDQIAKPFNSGLFEAVAFPSRLVNLGIKGVNAISGGGIPEIPIEGPRQTIAENTPFIAPRGQEAEGMLPRSMEILGASVGPAMTLSQLGSSVLKAGGPAAAQIEGSGLMQTPGLVRNGMMPGVASTTRLTPQAYAAELKALPQELAARTASAPLSSAAVEVGSSFGAGFGGESVSHLTDDPNMILLGELGGGFIFPATTAVTSVFRGTGVPGKTKAALTPFTEEGSQTATSIRAKELAVDPTDASRNIDPTSPVSGARQTGKPGLIKLEQLVLEQNPKLAARYTEELKAAMTDIEQRATQFGGTDRTREILKSGQEHLLKLVETRAKQAAQNAQAAVQDLGPSATSRDISRIAREELNKALTDMRAAENELWRSLDMKAPGAFSGAGETLASIKADESKLIESNVPAWLDTAINTKTPVTLNDLQKVRSKVLTEARAAKEAGDYDRARVLNAIANGDEQVINGQTVVRKGIIDDMEAVKSEGVKNASAFSRQLNDKFNKGSVAQILDVSARAGGGTVAADTLNKLFSGSTQATNAAEFLKASPGSKPLLEDFLKSRFLNKSSTNGQYDPKKAANEIAKMDEDGIFEVFPELKTEMDNVSTLLARSERLSARATEVGKRGGSRMGKNDRDSLAKFILGAEPRQEISRVLSAENPVKVAEALRVRMSGNPDAEMSLKTQFMETLWKGATKQDANGDSVISSKDLMNAFNKNVNVAKALGMNDADITRARTAIKQLQQMQYTPTGKPLKSLLEDPLSRAVNFAVTTLGARAGAWFGHGTTGASLKTASTGSQMSGEIANEVAKSKTEKLIIEMIFNKDLMKAMLTKDTGTLPERTMAGNLLEAWIVGSGVVVTDEAREKEKYRAKQGSENRGVMEPLNLGNQ